MDLKALKDKLVATVKFYYDKLLAVVNSALDNIVKTVETFLNKIPQAIEDSYNIIIKNITAQNAAILGLVYILYINANTVFKNPVTLIAVLIAIVALLKK